MECQQAFYLPEDSSDSDATYLSIQFHTSGTNISPNPGYVTPNLMILHPLYQLIDHLGSGGFGTVYLARGPDHRQCAIKIQPLTEGLSRLSNELTIYQRLLLDRRTGFPTTGIPRVYQYFEYQNQEFLVMERMGDSLESIMRREPTGSISKKSALMIGIQAVRRLETLHTHGVLHRDIKPDNIVMGYGPNDERTMYLIDFGLSQIVENWNSYDTEGKSQFVGTDYFASFETLFRKKPTRAGDLQSLAYTLLCSVAGDLPWVNIDEEYNRRLTHTELGIQRLRWKAEDLCRSFPELTQFVKIVCRLDRKQEPDYDGLVSILEEALHDMECENDGLFEWLLPNDQSGMLSNMTDHSDDTHIPSDYYFDASPITRESDSQLSNGSQTSPIDEGTIRSVQERRFPPSSAFIRNVALGLFESNLQVLSPVTNRPAFTECLNREHCSSYPFLHEQEGQNKDLGISGLSCNLKVGNSGSVEISIRKEALWENAGTETTGISYEHPSSEFSSSTLILPEKPKVTKKRSIVKKTLVKGVCRLVKAVIRISITSLVKCGGILF